MSSSSQAKEKLRKKLGQLFQKQDVKAPLTGKADINRQYRKGFDMNHMQEIGKVENLQQKENSSGPNKFISKQFKKQSCKMNPTPTNDASKQFRFVEEEERAKLNTIKKSDGVVLKNYKQKKTKLKQTQKSTLPKTDENNSSPLQTRTNNAKNTGSQKHNKIKKRLKEYSNLKNDSETKKCNTLKKSKGVMLNNYKQKETKLQNTQNSTSFNTNANNSPHPQTRSDNAKNTCSQQRNSNGVKNKNRKKCNNIKLENYPHLFQSDQTSTIKKSKLFENGHTIINKNRKRKAKLNSALADSINNVALVSNKKKKLAGNPDKTNENPTKFNQNLKNEADESSSSSLSYDDVKPITGCVHGGDYDYRYDDDDMEHDNWIQEESYSENDYNSDHILEGNNVVQKLNNCSQTDLETYDHVDSEEEYFSSDDEYHGFDNYYRNTYDEDDDSYDCSMYTDDEFSSGRESYYSDMSYVFNESYSDDDYQLPKCVPEDLIIQKGTAIKYDLKPEDNVSFNSDNEELQIMDLEENLTVKVICQPKAYEKEELLKLKYEEKYLSTTSLDCKESISNGSEDCPKLVPIVDENGFQQVQEEEENEEQSMEEYEYNSMSDISIGSEYTEVKSDDTDSLQFEDINEKYLKAGYYDSETDNSIDENMWNKKHKVDVIDATCYKCENKVDSCNDNSNISENDDINETPLVKFFENVDLNTESNILCTTIVDSNIFTSNENTEELCAESNETQNTPSKTAGPRLSEDVYMENYQIATENSAKQSSKVTKSFGQSLVGYNTKFFNALNTNFVIALLKDPFYIYGTVRLTLLAGTIEVYGHSLILNREVEIFSPRGCSIIEISSTRRKTVSNKDLSQILKSYEQHFALADLKSIANMYNCETDAVVLLKRNDARKKVVQQVKKFMKENVFPNINNINVDRPLYSSEYMLRCMINTFVPEEKCLRLPKQWQQLSITPNSCVMLAGGKGVGKSTLLRYLINRHLPQEILLIDLDIGQPEIFVPQTVSCTIVKQPLLGPGFLLNIQPEMSYTVGHTNIELCADKYIVAVRSLIVHCKSQAEYKEMPWIINTMGYNKGFGLELISVIAQELPLTDVIQLQNNKDVYNFDCILHSHVLSSVPNILFSEYCDQENTKENLNYRLHVWSSAVQHESRYLKDWDMSAKDLRFAMLLSRLSEALHGHADWLTDVKPLRASLDELRIINLMNNNHSATEEELTKSIEANLVYLCHFEDDFKPLKCLGIGVVRAVDFQLQQLYLIPALPHTLLKEVNCVAIGEMPLPSSVFTNQGPKVKNIAPFVYNTIADNASKAIKQIYHRPHKFLTGRRKSLY